MKFDMTNAVDLLDGLRVEYGIIRGNGHIVVIKAGSGGSYMGDGEKYARMAHRLHDAYGCTVICLSNFSTDSFERGDVAIIREVISGMDGEIFLYYIGNSNGGTQGVLAATKHFVFQRMLLINMPLMLNFHKIKEAIAHVGGTNEANTEIRFVYGSKDPSYAYVPFLENACRRDRCSTHVEIERILGADHNFAGMLDVFVELCMR